MKGRKEKASREFSSPIRERFKPHNRSRALRKPSRSIPDCVGGRSMVILH